MRTVRTTIEPHRDVEVDDAEYVALKAQGLLIEDREKTPDSKSTPAAAPATTSSNGKRSSDKESTA